MGEANDVTSQKAPKDNYGAGDITADLVRLRALSIATRDRSNADVLSVRRTA